MAGLIYRKVTLAGLPSDIIRRIIRLDLDSINAMRLISPRWNDYALEYYQDRKDRPDIETLYLRIAHGKVKSIRLQIPEKERRYFGVDGWTTFGKNQFCNGLFDFDNNSYQWFEKEYNAKRSKPNLKIPFARCARLRTLIMTANFQNYTSLETIREVVRHMAPEIIVVSVNEFINEPFLLTCIRHTATKHLTFYSGRGLAMLGVDNAKRWSFYAEALTCIPTIEIIMTGIDHQPKHGTLQQQVQGLAYNIKKVAPDGLGQIFSRHNLSNMGGEYCLRVTFTNG